MLEIKMKWIVRAVIFFYMCYKAVYGGRLEQGLSVEQINYGEDGYLEVGGRKTINCKGYNRNQRLEWIDPFGKVVKRVHSDRVFAQEHFVASPKGGRAPGLVLTLTELKTSDSGVYQCKSGDVKKNVSLCVIQPSEFINTPKEITADVGRSITLTCQAKGDPEPRIIWTRDGYELPEEPNEKYILNVKYNNLGYESLLTVRNLEPVASGVFTCTSQQQSPMLDDCSYENHMNITLNVNHEPIFEYSDDIKFVYGKPNQVVDLVCSASAYPSPTYRWFKDLGGDTLLEFEQKQIVFSEPDNQAVLSITAGPTTFGQRYKCKATNTLGDAEKTFMLLKIEKPSKASEVNLIRASRTQIVFNVTYLDDLLFPITEFTIQYLKSSQVEQKKRGGIVIPKESDWRKSHIEVREYSDDIEGNVILLKNLEPETEYWVRIRASNEAGDAPWSDPAFLETTDEDDEEVEAPEEEEKEEGDQEDDNPEDEAVVADDNIVSGTFYGIFFAGAIAIIVVACVFVMRLV